MTLTCVSVISSVPEFPLLSVTDNDLFDADMDQLDGEATADVTASYEAMSVDGNFIWTLPSTGKPKTIADPSVQLMAHYNITNMRECEALVRDCDTLFQRLLKLGPCKVGGYRRQLVSLQVDFAKLSDFDTRSMHGAISDFNPRLHKFLSSLVEISSAHL